MKALSITFLLVFAFTLQGSENLERARQLEASGDGAEARALLAHAAQSAPNDIAALTEYAEFLDCHADPAAMEAYGKLLAALDQPAHGRERAAVARRMAELSFLQGDRAGALRSLEIYHNSGGAAPGSATPAAAPPGNPAGDQSYVEIPGPVRSFSRMSAISRDAQADDLLPALAGPDKVVRIENCESPNAGELLRILGFRMRGGCGSEVVLETVNATRAFLTTDSGFPLPALEQALRTNRPFTYDYHPARVPVLFGSDYWLSAKEKETSGFLDVLLSDPALCRLYLGFSKLDRETAEEFRKNIPMPHLRAYAHVLDFFGGMFEVRAGKAVI